VLFDLTEPMSQETGARLEALAEELGPVLDMLFDHATVQSRFEGAGRLDGSWCQSHGIVGPAARACGVTRDVRHDHPYGIYRFAHIPVATAWAGDVLARALVRRLEVQRSLEFLIERVRALPQGELRVPCGAPRPDELVVVLTEGWRGEIAHVLVTGPDGAVVRHKVVDPSFHNWAALAEAMPGNQISDFPLCNKSFNLSYAGHDI
jgi:Ni,Fe-hydrogenase III large subunit